MAAQLVLDIGVDTLCCKHCRRLPDGRCAWITGTGLGAHLADCSECRRAR